MATTLPDYQKEYESLSGRLDSIDQAYSKILPTSQGRIQQIGRGVGENPLNVVLAQLGLGDQYRSAREPVESQKNSLLTMLQRQFENEQDQSNKDREYGLNVATSGLSIGADGSLQQPTGIDSMSDADATALVRQKFGKDIFLGTTEKDRGAKARLLLKDLEQGVQIPINDLLTDAEKTARTAATNLLNEVSSVYGLVTDQEGKVINATGVGKFGGGWGINPKNILGMGQTLRSKITGITAAKIKELSGAAVSDKEVERLSGMLPQVTDSEFEIAGKAKEMATMIQIGMAMQEKAKLENLTLDQAYLKYAAPLYQKAGLEVSDWLGGGAINKPGPQPTGTSGNPNDLVNKYWGN
jgi:hypothetical protein